MLKKMQCDFMAAGGGYSGICAAIQAGRLGLKTILAEKEMMLGGNGGPNLGVGASATMICNPYWNETGIIEEIEERVNYHRARIFPTNFGYNIHPLWDDVITKMLEEAGVTILRKHIVLETKVEGDTIKAVTLLNVDNLDRVEVEINGYIQDATGDAFVAELSGAKWRMGREARSETGERSAPVTADDIISTASITALVVDSGQPCEFIPPEGTPPWNPEKPNNHFDPDKKIHFLWQVDEGGESEENHSLYTPQELYRRLVYRIYSVWNYLKNIKFPVEAKNHQLVWISPILGRRESRRIEGDYLLTQTDVEALKTFPDSVGFAGHYLDEHMPSYDGGYEVRYYGRPLPFDIPLRSLYSKNIRNLFSGGRNIGVSHLAFTSTRLMRTCGTLGQAVAVAAKICMEKGITPRELANQYPELLQQRLQENDVFIIGAENKDPGDLARKARVTVSSEAALSREASEGEWKSAVETAAVAIFDCPQRVEKVAFYIRNTSEKEVEVNGFVGYGESPDIQLFPVPEYVYNPETKKYEEKKEFAADTNETLRQGTDTPTGTSGWAEYYKRVDNIEDFEKYVQDTQMVPAGFEGWVTWNLYWNKGFPSFDRSKTGQAVVLGLTGEVEVLTAPHKVDVVEGLFMEDGRLAADLKNIPVFKITPDHLPGAARNIINGKLHREGRAKLNQWMSNPAERLPQWICLNFEKEIKFSKVQVRFDVTERLWKEMYVQKGERTAKRLVSDYRIEVLTREGWKVIAQESENFKRFREHMLEAPVWVQAVKLTVFKVWGEGEPSRVYEIRVY